MKRGMMWPIAVAAILGTTVAGNFVVLYLANDDPSFAIEPDYYAKALRWDDEMAQERRNAELGWRLAPTLGPVTGGGATLTVRLTDAAGAPLRGATLRVAALHLAHAAAIERATLVAGAGGEYTVRLPVAHDGQWELRFEATRGAERFTAVRRVDAGPAPLAARTRS